MHNAHQALYHVKINDHKLLSRLQQAGLVLMIIEGDN